MREVSKTKRGERDQRVIQKKEGRKVERVIQSEGGRRTDDRTRGGGELGDQTIVEKAEERKTEERGGQKAFKLHQGSWR